MFQFGRGEHDVPLDGVLDCPKYGNPFLVVFKIAEIRQLQHLWHIIKLFVPVMKFASHKLRAQIEDSFQRTEGTFIPDPLTYCRNKNKTKYRECLKMVEEWSSDLLEREDRLRKMQESLPSCTVNK